MNDKKATRSTIILLIIVIIIGVIGAYAYSRTYDNQENTQLNSTEI